MGYYGLGPGMRVADQLTVLEKALRGVPVDLATAATLDVLETLLKNIAQNPKEGKFRRIKLANKKISAAITSVTPALEALLAVGFEVEEAEGELFLVLPADVKVDFPTHVSKIIDARDYFRKENEKARVAKGLGRVAPPGEKGAEDARPAEDIAVQAAANLKWLKTVDASAYKQAMVASN
ncbi:unnamed protein product [Amoebophrya sp. A25]|nr:unnamed protein product [Amoebophrya sp. A25]|eukprot:GSA25T00010122001.1